MKNGSIVIAFRNVCLVRCNYSINLSVEDTRRGYITLHPRNIRAIQEPFDNTPTACVGIFRLIRVR